MLSLVTLSLQVLKEHSEIDVVEGSLPDELFELVSWIRTVKLPLRDQMQEYAAQGKVQELGQLATHFDLSAEGVWAGECLQRACRGGHLEMAQWLTAYFWLTAGVARAEDRLERDYVDHWTKILLGIHTSRPWTGGNYCLRYACESGHLETIQWLINHFGLTVKDIRAGGNDCLHRACQGGHLTVVWWLITQSGLTADDISSRDNYCLQYACRDGQLDLAQYLVDMLGRIDEHDLGLCLEAACEGNHLGVARWLAERFTMTH